MVRGHLLRAICCFALVGNWLVGCASTPPQQPKQRRKSRIQKRSHSVKRTGNRPGSGKRGGDKRRRSRKAAKESVVLYGIDTEAEPPGCQLVGTVEAWTVGEQKVPTAALKAGARDLEGNGVTKIQHLPNLQSLVEGGEPVHYYSGNILLCPGRGPPPGKTPRKKKKRPDAPEPVQDEPPSPEGDEGVPADDPPESVTTQEPAVGP